jgi:hypothetical protein
MERMKVEDLWEAQQREWPGSVRMSVQEVFEWCDKAESVKQQLHRYVQVAMALQYPAVVFYHLENPRYRGFRFGVEGHEYMAILEV